MVFSFKPLDDNPAQGEAALNSHDNVTFVTSGEKDFDYNMSSWGYFSVETVLIRPGDESSKRI